MWKLSHSLKVIVWKLKYITGLTEGIQIDNIGLRFDGKQVIDYNLIILKLLLLPKFYPNLEGNIFGQSEEFFLVGAELICTEIWRISVTQLFAILQILI